MATKRIARNSFRVAVVDDEEDTHLLIKHILQRTQEFSCVGCFSDGTNALAALPRLCPDLVLMDIRMPGLSGIECTRRLKHVMPGLKVIMLSVLDDADSIKASLHAGAVWYLLKPTTTGNFLFNLRVGVCVATEMRPPSPASESVASVAHAAENRARLTERKTEVLDRLPESPPHKEGAIKNAYGNRNVLRSAPQGAEFFSDATWGEIALSLKLSGRELEITRGVFDNLTEGAIAANLGISANTVHTHLNRLFIKLHASTRAQMVLCVMEEWLTLALPESCDLPPSCRHRVNGRCPIQDLGKVTHQ